MRRPSAVAGTTLALAFVLAAASSAPADVGFEVVHAFRTWAQPVRAIQATDGSHWVVTRNGGAHQVGAVFRRETSGLVKTVHSFRGADGEGPIDLIQAADGSFWGVTPLGGASSQGTVFRVAPGGSFGVVLSFAGANGSAPGAGLIQGSDGHFYGTTMGGGASGRGTVFEIDAAGQLTTLHSFAGPDGRAPAARLLEASDGHLYGTTSAGGAFDRGVIFRVTKRGEFTLLHSFGLDGQEGLDPLELIQAAGGTIYGITRSGGVHGQGTIFALTSSGTPTTLMSFGPCCTAPIGPDSLIATSDGTIYGTTGGLTGTLYVFDPQTRAATVLHEFGSGNPRALAEDLDGGLLGVGSACSAGSVFRRAPAGAVTELIDFLGPTGPHAGLVRALDGRLHGTVVGGSLSPGCGVRGGLYALDVRQTPAALEAFDTFGLLVSTDSGLTLAPDGSFYGTSPGGGSDHGSIYRLSRDGTFGIVHVFSGSDGKEPRAEPVLGADGAYYGTTRIGGAFDRGTVYRFDPSASLTTLHSFTGTDGQEPGGTALVRGSDGSLYGVAPVGGAFGGGTLFRIDATGVLTVLHSFQGSDGRAPSGLIEGKDGKLYGTTGAGGTSDRGTLFSFDGTTGLRTLHSFRGADGEGPLRIMQAMDGHLYGVTYRGGPSDQGTVYKFDLEARRVTTLVVFTGQNGQFPESRLTQVPDGRLYGTASFGGPEGAGVVFRLLPPDTDLDGVADTVENGAANGGDGNGDGIPDGEQPNVTSMPAALGASYVTLAAPDGIVLTGVSGTPAPPAPDPPADSVFPVGFYAFTAQGLAVAGSTTVQLFLPPGVMPTGYAKYGPTPDNPTPHWYDFPFDGATGAVIDGNVVTLHFVDGQRGDDDLDANGIIVDDGTPVVASARPVLEQLRAETLAAPLPLGLRPALIKLIDSATATITAAERLLVLADAKNVRKARQGFAKAVKIVASYSKKVTAAVDKGGVDSAVAEPLLELASRARTRLVSVIAAL